MKNRSNIHQIQDNSQSSTTMTEYLTIIRNFILQMHQRVNQQFDPQPLPSNLMNIIDKAAIKLKKQKQHISILQKQNKDYNNTKILLNDLKSDQTHLEKRFNQKNDQISILRQTVKTLYADNEKLNTEKQKINKQFITAKQNATTLKKKLKKQQQEMNKHKIQLQKLTKIAQERLGQYASQDKQKQKTIKKNTQQNQRLKIQVQKLSKQVQQLKKTNEQLARVKLQNQGNYKLIDALKYQNQLCKKQNHHLQTELNILKQKTSSQIESLKHDVQLLKDKNQALTISNKQFQLTNSQFLIKIRSLQEDITMRTQKLKQKNSQIKQYNEQISKLVQRIQNLSLMSDEVIEQNKQLNEKCKRLEERLEEYRILQTYISKVKGDLNYSKSMELGKLIEGLGSIKEHI